MNYFCSLRHRHDFDWGARLLYLRLLEEQAPVGEALHVHHDGHNAEAAAGAAQGLETQTART